jgi:hypothetical protein
VDAAQHPTLAECGHPGEAGGRRDPGMLGEGDVRRPAVDHQRRQQDAVDLVKAMSKDVR